MKKTKKKAKRGRPRLPASERLSKQLNCRFTKGEFPLLTKAAERAKVGGVQEWARLALLSAADK